MMNVNMCRLGISMLTGFLYALGLGISGMLDPTRVQHAFDITGIWDISIVLAFAITVLVALFGYRLIFQRERPICTQKFRLPKKKEITVPLIVGAILFGLGLGMSGFTPGNTCALLFIEPMQALLFLGALFLGVFISQRFIPKGTVVKKEKEVEVKNIHMHEKGA